MNGQLASAGANFRLEKAECLGAPGYAGRTIYFNNRGNKQLDTRFVAGDPNRGGRMDITWINDFVDGATSSGLTSDDTYSAITRAMATWDGVVCSTIPLAELDSNGSKIDWGYIEWLSGGGGVSGWYADITHAGWLPRSFFDTLAPQGGDSILSVTFTFIWIHSGTGEPTDIDRNGKLDVAFCEIYYNDAFPWGINTGWPVDVESVALHEAGHGLSQAHFGMLFPTPSKGTFHFAPRAVMNAGHTGVQQELTGSDVGGHCSIWSSWPNR